MRGNPQRPDSGRERGGAKRLRTADLRRARAALSQLSYSPGNPFAFTEHCGLNPASGLVGLGGLEPPTLRLSGARSNHLSYRPVSFHLEPHPAAPSKLGRRYTDLWGIDLSDPESRPKAPSMISLERR